MKVYLIGSLRNPDVPHLGNKLRQLGFDVMDHWWGGGPEADDWWQAYERIRGRSYREALYDHYSTHIWAYDKQHLNTCDLGIMIHPVGRSAHIELGFLLGQGKPCYVLFDAEPERFDVMYRFVDDVFFDQADLLDALSAIIEKEE